MSSDRLRHEMEARERARAMRQVNGGIVIPTAQQQQQAMGHTFMQTFLACVPAVAGSSAEMGPEQIVERAEKIAVATLKKMGIEIAIQSPQAPKE